MLNDKDAWILLDYRMKLLAFMKKYNVQFFLYKYLKNTPKYALCPSISTLCDGHHDISVEQ